MVVAYASTATLRDCLEALPRDRLHGVVVVDNGSPTDDARIAGEVPGVQVVRQDNVGFGGGCNRGAAALPDAELLLFLNPDAIVGPDDLALLVAHLDGSPSCGLAGPRLYSAGEPLTSAGRRGGVRTELRTVVPTALAPWFPQRRYPPDYDRTGPAGYVEGACFLVRAEVLRALGGFDESFFLFFEEMDLARRLAGRGMTVDLVAAARAEHQRAVSRSTLPDAGRVHLLRSTVVYLRGEARWKALVYVVIARACFLIRRRGLGPTQSRAWADAVTGAYRDVRGTRR